jgi:hypothetical protein
MVDFVPDWLRLRGLGWNSMVPHGWSPSLLNVKSALTHRYDEGMEGDRTVFGLEVHMSDKMVQGPHLSSHPHKPQY